ncbi:uncharacterized protein LOC132083906 isoform X2 [Ammospiza nelsoni]|uniref:uncharacterized protein LOC132083906 isoform X2 n=1 Tax=Ammospiza nelsoni TaxID=2857394 RepID=UPI00286A5012|nr:uncharacterized protein LOC132083906 isoform X2 [Ammospiza nelsoni]
MEFSELIKTATVEDVLLSRQGLPAVRGTLCITSHHLLLSSCPRGELELWLLIRNVDAVEKRVCGSSGTITLRCKDLQVLQLEIPGMEQCLNIASSIEALSSVDSVMMLYPFFYRPPSLQLQQGWHLRVPECHFQRVALQTSRWRLSTVNGDFSACPSYPPAVVVPAAVPDDTVARAARFRQGGRFPVLSYFHPKNGTVSPGCPSARPPASQKGDSIGRRLQNWVGRDLKLIQCQPCHGRDTSAVPGCASLALGTARYPVPASAALGKPFQPLPGKNSFPKSHPALPPASGKPFPVSCPSILCPKSLSSHPGAPSGSLRSPWSPLSSSLDIPRCAIPYPKSISSSPEALSPPGWTFPAAPSSIPYPKSCSSPPRTPLGSLRLPWSLLLSRWTLPAVLSPNPSPALLEPSLLQVDIPCVLSLNPLSQIPLQLSWSPFRLSKVTLEPSALQTGHSQLCHSPIRYPKSLSSSPEALSPPGWTVPAAPSSIPYPKSCCSSPGAPSGSRRPPWHPLSPVPRPCSAAASR